MGSWLYLLAVVSCIGHAHQVLVGPAVQVCVLPADDAIASIAGPALAAVHGVAVMAQVVALGVLVAVMSPIRAGVAGLAHLRAHGPDVNEDPWRAPDSQETRTSQLLSSVSKWTEAPWGKSRGYLCLAPFYPWGCPGDRVALFYVCVS